MGGFIETILKFRDLQYLIMFYLATKKDLKKESTKVKSSFQRRDEKSNSQDKLNEKEFKKLQEKINSTETKIARLEGALSVILENAKKEYQSQSHAISTSPKRSLETRAIAKIRRTKKGVIMAEIERLMPTMEIIDIYDKIVLEQGLCSKASFYRYVNDLKSQGPNKTETKLKQKKK